MEKDAESASVAGRGPQSVPHWRIVRHQGLVTPEVSKWQYEGAGTEEDPYVVTWIDNDPRNPMSFSQWKKWSITALMAIATLAVAFVSSAFSGGIDQVLYTFHTSTEVVTSGISLFVSGFAIGPSLWAPSSESFGRQISYIITYGASTAFNAGAAGSQNIQTLLILRFFAGAFGSSPLTNAGGVIADMFAADERGSAMSLFAVAPFMGPVLGPIVGGFSGETEGWRWVEGLMAIFTGVFWILGLLLLPETYPPVSLRRRAEKSSKMTGKVYRSRGEIQQGKTSSGQSFKTSLSRPWISSFREPIVFSLSIYMAIIYGTLYMSFAAYPIVYQEYRGWSQGIGGSAFLGVAVGMIGASIYSIWDNKRYVRTSKAHDGFAPPEARMPPCSIGTICLPIGLIWFAWTDSPDIHWMASIAAGAPFGFGMVLVFLSIMNYLIDSYTIFAASVSAANSVSRSLFGAAFPLFTTQMYANLGIHWATMVPAFLALACVPFPFLFYKYGGPIRQKCKFAAQADAFMRQMRQQTTQKPGAETQKKVEEEERSAIDSSYDSPKEEVEHDAAMGEVEMEEERELGNEPRFEEIRAPGEGSEEKRHELHKTRSYEGNPYDLDLVNTRESFTSERRRRSRAGSRA